MPSTPCAGAARYGSRSGRPGPDRGRDAAGRGAGRGRLGARGAGRVTPPRDRILVVEDERAQRDALAQYLGRLGHPVTAVATGEEAVGLLQGGSYAILITDLRLPGMS